MQRELDFAAIEGTHAERRNLLGLALARVEASLAVRVLVEWVWNIESRTGRPLEKTYAELAARPWGLCCEPRAARYAVEAARRLRLVLVDPQLYGSLGQRANAYRIDWAGVESILKGPTADPAPHEPGGTQRHPPGTQRHPSAVPCHHNKETPLFCFVSNPTPPTPPTHSRPSPARPAPVRRAPDPDASQTGWAAVAAELREVGVRRADELAAECREAGASPESVLEACGVYRANARRFRGPGAVAEFLRHGAWPCDGPLVDPAAAARDAAARDARRQQARAAEAAERAAAERLERAHGPALDALDAAGREALIAALPEGTRATVARLGLGPQSAMLRGLLLGLLESGTFPGKRDAHARHD